MEKTNASRSAGIIAAHRAFESSKPEPERVCYDQYARQFLPERMTVIGESDFPEEVALGLFKDLVPGFHEFFIARTRYIDEFLQNAIHEGVNQLVILGAGYDSRPYRFIELANTSIFEVDQKSTQEIKKAKVLETFAELPVNITYTPINFLTENLEDRLFEAGYDPSVKTVFIWEGVTMYVDPVAVDETLLFIAHHSGEGSKLIFDHTFEGVLQGTIDRKEALAWPAIAEKNGEPLLFGIGEDGVEEFLTRRGFHSISAITSDYFNKTYYTGINAGRESTPILALCHALTGYW